MGEVTALIALAHAGDRLASARLFTDVQGELKRIAERQIRRIHDAPMHTSGLAHEACFRACAIAASIDAHQRLAVTISYDSTGPSGETR